MKEKRNQSQSNYDTVEPIKLLIQMIDMLFIQSAVHSKKGSSGVLCGGHHGAI